MPLLRSRNSGVSLHRAMVSILKPRLRTMRRIGMGCYRTRETREACRVAGHDGVEQGFGQRYRRRIPVHNLKESGYRPIIIIGDRLSSLESSNSSASLQIIR